MCVVPQFTEAIIIIAIDSVIFSMRLCLYI